MSDEDVLSEPEPTIKQVIDFFNEVGKGGQRPCPVCNTTAGWVFFSKPSSLTHIKLTLTSDEDGKVLPVYAIVCRNCHFVRFHAKRYVDQQIAELRSAKGDS